MDLLRRLAARSTPMVNFDGLLQGSALMAGFHKSMEWKKTFYDEISRSGLMKRKKFDRQSQSARRNHRRPASAIGDVIGDAIGDRNRSSWPSSGRTSTMPSSPPSARLSASRPSTRPSASPRSAIGSQRKTALSLSRYLCFHSKMVFRYLCRRFSSFLVDWKVEKRTDLIHWARSLIFVCIFIMQLLTIILFSSKIGQIRSFLIKKI